jgi:hypothetical protein
MHVGGLAVVDPTDAARFSFELVRKLVATPLGAPTAVTRRRRLSEA